MNFVRILLAICFILPSFTFPQQTPVVTPDQIIQAVNVVRAANRLPALKVNAILMDTAQYAADVMAAKQASSVLGGVKERIIAAGYGSGSPSDSIWGTEDFATHNATITATQIISDDWSDEVHQTPMISPNYCDVGAGVSQTNDGSYVYVLHAAYNSDVPCGKKAPTGSPSGQTLTPTEAAPQWIVPIIRSTPDAQGRIFHVVRQGQSLWYIAISYGTRINAILQLNNLPLNTKTLYNGERLIIPTSLTPLPSETPIPDGTAIGENTSIPPQLPTKISGTPGPSPTPTVDPMEQSAVDERFRGGLFIALVISVVLIVAGLILSRR